MVQVFKGPDVWPSKHLDVKRPGDVRVRLWLALELGWLVAVVGTSLAEMICRSNVWRPLRATETEFLSGLPVWSKVQMIYIWSS